MMAFTDNRGTIRVLSEYVNAMNEWGYDGRNEETMQILAHYLGDLAGAAYGAGERRVMRDEPAKPTEAKPAPKVRPVRTVCRDVEQVEPLSATLLGVTRRRIVADGQPAAIAVGRRRICRE